MWSISQGEVQAMLQDGGHIPTDVQHMINRRYCCSSVQFSCMLLHLH